MTPSERTEAANTIVKDALAANSGKAQPTTDEFVSSLLETYPNMDLQDFALIKVEATKLLVIHLSDV